MTDTKSVRVGLVIEPKTRARIDVYCVTLPGIPSRSEIVRRFIQRGLNAIETDETEKNSAPAILASRRRAQLRGSSMKRLFLPIALLAAPLSVAQQPHFGDDFIVSANGESCLITLDVVENEITAFTSTSLSTDYALFQVAGCFALEDFEGREGDRRIAEFSVSRIKNSKVHDDWALADSFALPRKTGALLHPESFCLDSENYSIPLVIRPIVDGGLLTGFYFDTGLSCND